MFTITIVGTGLMGGSLAFALRGFRDCEIIGVDTNKEALDSAIQAGAIDRASEIEDAIKISDLTIFCTYPVSIIKGIKENMSHFKKGSVVSDICGTKNNLYNEIKNHIREDIDYIGIHPMAGKEVDGFVNADKNIYLNTGFIIVPVETTKASSIDLMKEIAEYIKASRICTSNIEEHDYIIAYTSELMHISSTMLCLDYPDKMTLAYTAGAFRDCTRIANINPELWTELFLENKDNIKPFLQKYIENLTTFQTALENSDCKSLLSLLEQARDSKKELLVK